MIITSEISLELNSIAIRQNPLPTRKGNFVEYKFNMFSPSEFYFFKKPKIGDDDFSVFWGSSPNVIFYRKEWKPLNRQIKEIIKQNLVEPFTMDNLENWRLAYIGGSPRNDRDWKLWVNLRHWNKGITSTMTQCIDMNKNAMSRIIAELPEISNQDLKFS